MVQDVGVEFSAVGFEVYEEDQGLVWIFIKNAMAGGVAKFSMLIHFVQEFS